MGIPDRRGGPWEAPGGETTWDLQGIVRTSVWLE